MNLMERLLFLSTFWFVIIYISLLLKKNSLEEILKLIQKDKIII